MDKINTKVILKELFENKTKFINTFIGNNEEKKFVKIITHYILPNKEMLQLNITRMRDRFFVKNKHTIFLMNQK